jgi:hypothetical protein
MFSLISSVNFSLVADLDQYPSSSALASSDQITRCDNEATTLYEDSCHTKTDDGSHGGCHCVCHGINFLVADMQLQIPLPEAQFASVSWKNQALDGFLSKILQPPRVI